MKELIAFQGGGLGIGEKGRPMGPTERSFEVGQTDQVRGVQDFVDI